jgi:hypothetical protein
MDMRTLQEEQQCQQCRRPKSLSAFPGSQGKRSGLKKICQECEQRKRDERHHRIMKHHEMGGQQEREDQRHHLWEQRVLFRQIWEEQDREQEHWYQQQPARRCPTCRQILPASAFGGYTSANGFTLYRRCRSCHAVMLERRHLPCCLCQKRIPRQNFLSSLNGDALCGDGAAISLCCQACESAFLALSHLQQEDCIRLCCQRAFPVGQVIYAEVDPQTQEIRYIGRTGRPERRHLQHLSDRCARESHWGPEQIPWFTRRNWVQALADKGLAPSMTILRAVDVAPLVLEWEQRFIFHGIEQGWNLLNRETMEKERVNQIKTAGIDFLVAPFEVLVQQGFFAPQGVLAFLHRWYGRET